MLAKRTALRVIPAVLALASVVPGFGPTTRAASEELDRGALHVSESSGSTFSGVRVLGIERPVEKVTPRILQEAVRVIVRRLNGLGVANAIVYSLDNDIVIDLPGAKDDVQVLKVLTETGQLFFRPVDCIIPALYVPPSATPSSRLTGTTTTPANICNASQTAQAEYNPPHGNKYGVTPPQQDNANETVVLPNYSGYAAGRYVLAPAEMTGNIVKTATADLDSQTDEWEVVLNFTGAGSTAFNKYAAAHYACYKQNTANPPYCALQAIELDGTVESAPSIDSNNFPGSAQISGSSSAPFTQQEAQSIAFVLSYGSLPLRFVSQEIETVSPASSVS
jgi:protein-export membrane protein SecD